MENFQSHENTVLDLSPGVNVIVGASDQGKSAIIRAIRWLFFNEPRGSDFVRVGSSGPCRVTAELDDGTVITRERSGSRNVYELRRPSGEVCHFEGFGTDIPVEIIEAHGMRKVSLDDQLDVALNLSSQLDPPFLLTQPGSARAKAIGRISGVHVLDLAVKMAARELGSVDALSDQIAGELEGLHVQLETFKDLPAEKALIERLTDLLRRLQEAQGKMSAAMEVKRELSEISEQTAQARGVLVSTAGLERCSMVFAEIESGLFRLKELKGLEDDLRATEKSLKAGHEYMERFASLDDAERFVGLIGDTPGRLGELRQLRLELRKTLSEVDQTKSEIKKTAESADRLISEYAEALRTAGKCPVCMSDITSATIEHIISELRSGGGE